MSGQSDRDIARIDAMTPEEKERGRHLLQQMKIANLDPSATTDLARAYANREYRHGAKRKLGMLKKFLKRVDFLDSYSDFGYWKIVERLREVYPREGRLGLVELVAFYLHQKLKYDFYFGTSESEEDKACEETNE